MRSNPASVLYQICPSSYPEHREERMIQALDDFFWKCFFYLHANRISGDYLEFGCGSNVRSFRLAYKYKELECPDLRLFAFDSFKGLPEPNGIDAHPQWHKGAMAVSEDEFRDIMCKMGAQDSDYSVVPGFFNDSLHGKLPSTYGIQKAAMVFVDCDLYESTVSVLNFAKSSFVNGTILAFDDWFCYEGDPERGEQRAFTEFRQANPQLRFSDYLTFGWPGRSFLVQTNPSPRCRTKFQ